MASKICGSRCGVAKQATIINCLIAEDFKSFLVVLDKIIEDIPRRWQTNPRQALPGKTTVSISNGWWPWEIDYQQGVNDLFTKFQAINNLGAVIAVSAGNFRQSVGSANARYPALLATNEMPSLIRVGAVDKYGAPAFFSQEGDVYAVGVDSPCANHSNNLWDAESDGTSGGELFIHRTLLFSPRTSLSTHHD